MQASTSPPEAIPATEEGQSDPHARDAWGHSSLPVPPERADSEFDASEDKDTSLGPPDRQLMGRAAAGSAAVAAVAKAASPNKHVLEVRLPL